MSLYLKVNIYVVNYRKFANIGIGRVLKRGRGYGNFNEKKSDIYYNQLQMFGTAVT